MADIGLFEAIHTARAIRHVKPDPVPDELIEKVIDAGIRAPSAVNYQNWLFVVVKDRALRAKIGALYRDAGEKIRTQYAARLSDQPAHMNEARFARLMKSAAYLREHLADAPVLLVACLRARKADQAMAGASGSAPAMTMRTASASIYPAVQNMILACRALGLGTVLTTLHTFAEDEIKALLGLPADVTTYALLPIGYPQEGCQHGPIKRLPVEQVTFLNTMATPWPRK
ncbi:MAG TPA: nitroreductase family protein [Candidatus Binataceae bacterium]|nr:nitroreductase family protein [Candidatus Binataceae bacterium]